MRIMYLEGVLFLPGRANCFSCQMALASASHGSITVELGGAICRCFLNGSSSFFSVVLQCTFCLLMLRHRKCIQNFFEFMLQNFERWKLRSVISSSRAFFALPLKGFSLCCYSRWHLTVRGKGERNSVALLQSSPERDGKEKKYMDGLSDDGGLDSFSASQHERKERYSKQTRKIILFF